MILGTEITDVLCLKAVNLQSFAVAVRETKLTAEQGRAAGGSAAGGSTARGSTQPSYLVMQTFPYGVLGLDRDEEITGYHLGACGVHSGHPYNPGPREVPKQPTEGTALRRRSQLSQPHPVRHHTPQDRWALPW